MDEAALAWGLAGTAAAAAVAVHLRKRLPARVGCWFCGGGQWVSFRERNSWMCRRCDQYNGFTKEGDYNIPPDSRAPRRVAFAEKGRFGPVNNGLCRKCNSNQQLKILQLAGFVPTNEKKFDAEIESFRLHLEKVYRLCSKCKKYLKLKLSSEKELHLKSKLVDSRVKLKEEERFHLKPFVNDFLLSALKMVTVFSLLLIFLNFCLHLDVFLSKNVTVSTKRHLYGTYKEIETAIVTLCNSSSLCNKSVSQWDTYFANTSTTVTDMMHSLNILKEKYLNWPDAMINTTLAMYILSVAGLGLHFTLRIFQFRSLSKFLCESSLRGLIFYNAKVGTRYLLPLQFVLLLICLLNMSSTSTKKEEKRQGKLQKLSKTSLDKSEEDNDELFSSESDSESYSSYCTARAQSAGPFFPGGYNRTDKQYYNSFCPIQKLDNSINSYCSSHYEGSPLNRSFNLNGKFYDCELNQSINDLNLGYSRGEKDSFVFSNKQYNTSAQNLFSPSPSVMRNKFVLSPSRLIHGTQQSWVAGGYWGVDSPRKSYKSGERSSSSSQSSGFESQASSIRRRQVESFPPSRDGSVCSEYEKNNECIFGNVTNSSPKSVYAYGQSFQPLQSPIFPSMKQNESVLIPGVRYDGCFQSSSKKF